ncbi:hypothetical protein [Sphaerotilus sp.]|uniref:hypothetical protein n=1 Tax=Sphaerotilus sp. TaxID=2093942 RepID=UPI00286DAD95|nr:hypothetical protein [Sphaerotilus sp.]
MPAGKRHGWRPCIGDEQVLHGIVFVLRTGLAREERPPRLDWGSGMTRLYPRN